MTEKKTDQWWDNYWKDEPVFTIKRCMSESDQDLNVMRNTWISQIRNKYKDNPTHWTLQTKIDMINAGYNVLVTESNKWYEERISKRLESE